MLFRSPTCGATAGNQVPQTPQATVNIAKLRPQRWPTRAAKVPSLASHGVQQTWFAAVFPRIMPPRDDVEGWRRTMTRKRRQEERRRPNRGATAGGQVSQTPQAPVKIAKFRPQDGQLGLRRCHLWLQLAFSKPGSQWCFRESGLQETMSTDGGERRQRGSKKSEGDRLAQLPLDAKFRRHPKRPSTLQS